MKKKAVVTVQPTVKSATGEVLGTLPAITLAGEKAKVDGATVIPYKAGGKFTKSGTIDFNDEMEDSEIYAVTNAALKKKSQKLDPDRLLGDGIANTSALMDITPTLSEDVENNNGTYFLFGPHGYKGIISMTIPEITIHFSQ